MYTKEELERNTILEDEKKEAREEGFNDGFNDGVKEQNMKVAQLMLAKNMNIKDIIEITGLDIKEIENLKK